jgi:hypothetical protein
MSSKKNPRKVDWKPIVQLVKIVVSAVVEIIRMFR